MMFVTATGQLTIIVLMSETFPSILFQRVQPQQGLWLSGRDLKMIWRKQRGLDPFLQSL
jgi:hypothetical protein